MKENGKTELSKGKESGLELKESHFKGNGIMVNHMDKVHIFGSMGIGMKANLSKV